MKIIHPKWITMLGVMLLLPMFSAGQTDNTSEKATIRPDSLGNAFYQLYKNYQSAVRAGLEKESENSTEFEIPLKYWTESIKALNPVKVYQHSGNIVIVLRIQDGAEQGWYVPTSLSFREPFLGIQRDDGFTFTGHDFGHGYEFKRAGKGQIYEQSKEATSISQDHIYSAALQAYRNYSLALNRGEEKHSAATLVEIPAKYWPDSIKALKPLKVYEHFLNVAIVLSIRNGIEEGIYVSNPISSYMPYSGIIGEDGFEIMRISKADSGINFRRARGK